MPFHKGYETPNLVLFDERKSSPREHISRFIGVLGPHASDHNLCLKEFLKSLIDRAYTWYTTLALEMVMMLNNMRQRHEEDLVTIVKHFRDLALDCYDEKDEEAPVEICISNIVTDYRVYLENISISQFLRLL
ncbi:hypothetical protein D8674_000181 [Pyrus ussuriensis x Pyrus communis]|uniref:Uncharacterized protein n=1 Tax=Pyrus ussuriensis x Pyrus communis TaxID=2448454 RepID=A0A5N5F587_9ROSA|nr:hypothetical protein D8674_000181 [Pyrus ussuriensis x Pyrus communis]